MVKMWAKNLIFSVIVSILITQFAETQSLRGPRDYGEELPVTRKATSTRIKTNQTSGTLQSLPEIKQELPVNSADSWEPSACTQCLNDKYLVHYLEKGCKPVDNGLFCKKPCPKYFDCPKRNSDVVVESCEYKGNLYNIGEKVPVDIDNPCKQGCFCDKNLDQQNISHPEIRCALVDCFNNFRAPTPNCFSIWEEGKCCPREKCLTQEQVLKERQCLYDGKPYHLGQKIYPKEDHCLECVCDERWNQTNPVKSSGCKPIKCEIQSNNNFRAGCLPIYHEKTCCPIEYFCAPPEEQQCKFDGKNYLIGENLIINREKTKCTCLVPPEFTCIQMSEEETKFSTSEEPSDYIKKFQTLPKIDITNPSNNPFANIPDLTKDIKCAPFLSEGLTCAGVNCTTIIDENGCQACKCQTPCPQLKCKKGCTLFATTPGVCPQCKCD